MYFADFSGQWGYNSGKSFILIHPDIVKFINTDKIMVSGQEGHYLGISDSGDFVSVLFKFDFSNALPNLNYYVVAPSLAIVEEYNGPMYDFRNFVKIEEISADNSVVLPQRIAFVQVTGNF